MWSSVVSRSVCWSLSCKNSWTDRDAVRDADFGGLEEPCIRWGLDPSREGALFMGSWCHREPLYKWAEPYRLNDRTNVIVQPIWLSIAASTGRTFSRICLSVCLSVHTLKGKHIELSATNLVNIYSVAVARHALTHRSKVRFMWLRKQSRLHGCYCDICCYGRVLLLPAWVCVRQYVCLCFLVGVVCCVVWICQNKRRQFACKL